MGRMLQKQAVTANASTRWFNVRRNGNLCIRVKIAIILHDVGIKDEK